MRASRFRGLLKHSSDFAVSIISAHLRVFRFDLNALFPSSMRLNGTTLLLYYMLVQLLLKNKPGFKKQS